MTGSLDRADKHLREIERLVAKYRASNPYEVLPTVQGDGQARPRLHFTRQPSSTLPFILGDCLYNIRAALDYMMSAIVPAANRSSVNYPIFWQKVWEPVVKGEDRERVSDRRTWADYTKGVDPDALAIIKENQPATPARDGDTHGLAMLNRLRNKDAHQRLTIVATALRDTVSNFVTADEMAYRGMTKPGEGLPDGAELHGLPEGAVNVEISGTPEVFIRLRPDDLGGYSIDAVRDALLNPTRGLFNLLRPFDRLP